MLRRGISPPSRWNGTKERIRGDTKAKSSWRVDVIYLVRGSRRVTNKTISIYSRQEDSPTPKTSNYVGVNTDVYRNGPTLGDFQITEQFNDFGSYRKPGRELPRHYFATFRTNEISIF